MSVLQPGDLVAWLEVPTITCFAHPEVLRKSLKPPVSTLGNQSVVPFATGSDSSIVVPPLKEIVQLWNSCLLRLYGNVIAGLRIRMCFF
ncbi:MAG: hypothetical protein JWM11_381 [Planctomycetaceae bacterium]|nr:hypothetical protein [Planctomycetaceae bacterium]